MEIITAYSLQQVLFQLQYITAWPVTNMMTKTYSNVNSLNLINDAKTKWLLSYWNIFSCIPNGQYYMTNMDNNPNFTVKSKKVKFSQYMTLKYIRGVQVHNLGIWRRWVINFMPHPLYTWEESCITWKGGWIGTTASLDSSRDTKMFCCCWDSNPGPPSL